MIDINSYRLRIGCFQQPGQRKLKNKFEVRKEADFSFFRRLLYFLLLLSIFSFMSTTSNLKRKDQ